MAANFSLGEAVLGTSVDLSGLDRGLGQAEGKTKGWTSGVGSILGTGLGVTLGNLATGGAMMAVDAIGKVTGAVTNLAGQMVTANASFEQYEVQFTVLLGSADKAKQRMQELAEFGVKTPFELPQVVEADRILQAFGFHAEDAKDKFGYAGKEILRIAGDVASGTGANFQDMSTLLGRFASGATGEAIMRMSELGITTKKELEAAGLAFDSAGSLIVGSSKSMDDWNKEVAKAQEALPGLSQELEIAQMRLGEMQATGKTSASTLLAQQYKVADLENAIQKANETINSSFTGSEGKSLEDATQIVLDLMNKKYGGMMDKQSQTFEGMLSNVKDWIGATTRELGKPIFEKAKEGLGKLLEFLSKPAIKDAITSIGTLLADKVGKAIEFLMPIANNLTGVLSDVFAEIKSGAPILDIVSDAAKGFLIALFGPGAEETVQKGFNIFWSIFDTFRGFFDFTRGGGLLGLFAGDLIDANTIESAKATVGQVFTEIGEVISGVWPTIQKAFGEIMTALAPLKEMLFGNSIEFWSLKDAIAGAAEWIIIWLVPAIQVGADWIAKTLIPAVISIVDWLQVNIPIAVQTAVTFWNTQLIPALQTAWVWFSLNILPVIISIATWMGINIPLAVQTISTFITGQLIPALTTMWSFVSMNIIPLFVAVANVIGAVLGFAIRELVAYWTGYLLPALHAVWTFFSGSILPLFMAVGHVIDAVVGFAVRNLIGLWNQLMEVIRPVITMIGTELSPVFEQLRNTIDIMLGPALETIKGFFSSASNSVGGLRDTIQDVINFLNNLADIINNLPVIQSPSSSYSGSAYGASAFSTAYAGGAGGLSPAFAGVGGNTFSIGNVYVTLERGDQSPEAFVDQLTRAVGVK